MSNKADEKTNGPTINYLQIIQHTFFDSIKQLNPITALKNPTIFILELCLFLMLALTVKPNLLGPTVLAKESNLIISCILLLTIFFSNFVEMLAKNIAKAQAENLSIIHGDIEVKRVRSDGNIEYVFSSQLKKWDIIQVKEGDLIPVDGEVLEGVATVDESAITGESSPVLKEPGTDISSSITSGTRVLSDSLLIKVTSEAGQTYLEQMVSVTEDSEKHKSPSELKLDKRLTIVSILLLLLTTSLWFIFNNSHTKIEVTFLITLLVCLLPITISSLATVIRTSGFNRINKLNVLVMSEELLEKTADISILLLDKTGTITFGNRMATEFIPLGTNSLNEIAKAAYLASCFDQTPEGKSIVSLARRYGVELDIKQISGIPHEFNAHTRMSGIDLDNKEIIRKGACDAIKKHILSIGGKIWPNTDQLIETIAIQGGTPLLISKNSEVIGLISLKDIIKTSIKDRFKEAAHLGIKTIMCTGDNDLTAKVISKDAGIDEYIAQAKPEEKIQIIKNYQSKGIVVGMIGDGTNDAPALAQADIGFAMNSGTISAKEASNMIDLDSDPTKIIEIIKIGKQIIMTRASITAFSITSNISKCFVILSSILPASVSSAKALSIMHLESNFSAAVSTLIFNALIIPFIAPIALNGVKIRANQSKKTPQQNLITFELCGLIIPLIGIKIIDIIVKRFI